MAIAGLKADADADTVPNLVEWALGLDPNKSDTGEALPEFQEIGSNTVRFRYQRNLNAVGLNYKVMRSANLTDWIESAEAIDQSLGTEENMDSREVSLSFSGVQSVFLRIDIEVVP